MESEGTIDDFLPGTLERMEYDGVHVALPWAIDIRILYYRIDVREEIGMAAPTNWEEFAAVAEAATGDGRYGFVMPGLGNLGMHTLQMFIFNNGGGFFTEMGELDVMNERNVEAAEFVAMLVENGWIHPGSAGFSVSDADRAFAHGEVAMYVRTPRIGALLPEFADQIGLASPMEGPHGDKGTISWVNNIMVYTQAENPAETLEFLGWYSENMAPLFTQGHTNQFPVRASIAVDPYFQEDPQATQILEEWIPVGRSMSARTSGIFPAQNELEGEGVLQTLLQDLLQGMGATDALEKVQPRIESIVNN